MADILVVDDEKMINDLLCMNLQMVGHTPTQAFTGREAMEKLDREKFDLALLDIMLPQMDGYQLLPYFIKKEIPVIYLTAKDSLTDRVKGLKSGADDYITKPFEAVELLARVEAVLRRCCRQQEQFLVDDVRIDFSGRRVYREGMEIELTSQEFLLLEVLARNCNIALSREQLLELAWGYEYGGETRTVDIHIQRLRKKLGLEKAIQTVYKYGYRMERNL